MGNENRYWRDTALGEPIDLKISGGTHARVLRGSGEPIVFVHGALVNANLWRKVVPILAPDFRCITLDMPLGSHELAMPDADLSPTGLADLIADADRRAWDRAADPGRQRLGRRPRRRSPCPATPNWRAGSS